MKFNYYLKERKWYGRLISKRSLWSKKMENVKWNKSINTYSKKENHFNNCHENNKRIVTYKIEYCIEHDYQKIIENKEDPN